MPSSPSLSQLCKGSEKAAAGPWKTCKGAQGHRLREKGKSETSEYRAREQEKLVLSFEVLKYMVIYYKCDKYLKKYWVTQKHLTEIYLLLGVRKACKDMTFKLKLEAQVAISLIKERVSILDGKNSGIKACRQKASFCDPLPVLR